MTTRAQDGELLAAYALDNSESAFDALVKRHAAMVFATAVRQVGQSSLAEEVTQNTFLVLARKAPRLSGNQTLAGWLHRAALLEAKSCIRQELRRRRREETAATLADTDREEGSPVAHLMPFLDEALLDLREEDRQALILRFLEGCSLREVGSALGVAEDAARKRVARALERVGEFFRDRGFVTAGGTPATAITAATAMSVLSGASAQSVPAGLTAGAIQSFVATSLTKPTLTFAGINFMAFNKPQAAVAALLLAAAPLAWQWRSQAQVQQERATLVSQSARASNSLAEIEAESERLKNEILHAQASLINAEIHLGEQKEKLANRQPAPVYSWNENAPLARVSKAFISKLSMPSISNRRGKLNGKMIDALQFTEEESQRAQESINRFLERHDKMQAQAMRLVDANEDDLEGRSPEELRVFDIPYDAETLARLREDLFADLRHVLGPERFPVFQKGLRDWMPVDDENHGINSGMAVVNADQRMVFFRPDPAANSISWRMKLEERGTLGMDMEISWMKENMPSHFLSQLRDWIELAKPLP